MIQKQRGTIDILPGESEIWQYVEEKIRKTAALYGYSEIRLPTFESSELYKRGVGETSDVVQKEMYSFVDNDGRSLTLRPEGTAGVVRSVIENSLVSDALPLSVYYMISCFRYEKPEAGRSREFYQFGAELFGADGAIADANVIAMADAVFKNLGIKNHLEINSIGCPHCRPKYHRALKDYFAAHTEKLCDTCLERLDKNPLRILDCKSPICSEIAADAPIAIDYLCSECAEHFEELKKYLDASKIGYRVNPKIVRGLDYYEKTVFEFISDDIGAQSTVCGGGRYDGLVEELGGPAISGIGFAMGLTRIMLALKNQNIQIDKPKQLYIASLGERAQVKAFETATALRGAGLAVHIDQMSRSLKAQMKYAGKKGFDYTLIIGDSEVDNNTAMLKNMADGSQTEVSLSDGESVIKIIKGE